MSLPAVETHHAVADAPNSFIVVQHAAGGLRTRRALAPRVRLRVGGGGLLLTLALRTTHDGPLKPVRLKVRVLTPALDVEMPLHHAVHPRASAADAGDSVAEVEGTAAFLAIAGLGVPPVLHPCCVRLVVGDLAAAGAARTDCDVGEHLRHVPGLPCRRRLAMPVELLSFCVDSWGGESFVVVPVLDQRAGAAPVALLLPEDDALSYLEPRHLAPLVRPHVLVLELQIEQERVVPPREVVADVDHKGTRGVKGDLAFLTRDDRADALVPLVDREKPRLDHDEILPRAYHLEPAVGAHVHACLGVALACLGLLMDTALLATPKEGVIKANAVVLGDADQEVLKVTIQVVIQLRVDALVERGDGDRQDHFLLLVEECLAERLFQETQRQLQCLGTGGVLFQRAAASGALLFLLGKNVGVLDADIRAAASLVAALVMVVAVSVILVVGGGVARASVRG